MIVTYSTWSNFPHDKFFEPASPAYTESWDTAILNGNISYKHAASISDINAMTLAQLIVSERAQNRDTTIFNRKSVVVRAGARYHVSALDQSSYVLVDHDHIVFCSRK